MTTHPRTDLEQTQIPARDGYPLAATIYPASTTENPTAEDGAGPVVILNSASAVPRGFYRQFATALAAAGYTVITYDYRGIAESRPSSLRGFEARTSDWGLLDMSGVIAHVRAELRPSRLFMIGHSVGGQLAGLLDNADQVDAMVTFSSQSGYWRYQGKGQKLPVALHTHLTLPIFAHLLGYVPWSKFAKAEDLPKNVALQWARWCRNPEYLMSDDSLPLHRYAQFQAPILAFSIADDTWGTRLAVDRMMSNYPTVERRHLEPTDHGLRSIGHFGYFRRDAQALWAEPIAWLATQS